MILLKKTKKNQIFVFVLLNYIIVLKFGLFCTYNYR